MVKITEIVKEKVLLFDGAMGTSLINYGLGKDDYHGHMNCHDYLSISRPDVIKEVHSAYFKAGCDIVETNSFGANPIVFAEFGIAEKALETAKAAAMIAREVAHGFSTNDKPRFVSGSVGPGSKLPTLLQTDFDTMYRSYCVQISGLIEGGIDLIQIETCQDILQIKCALIAAYDTMKKYSRQLPVIVQVTIERNGRMLLGTPLEAVVTAFAPYDLFALGMNCGTGPDSMHESVKNLKKISPFRASILPNAGFPELVNGKLEYSLTVEQFASHIGTFVKEYGVELVGGCCGTTPAHLEAAARIIAGYPQKKVQYPQTVPSVSSTFAAVELNADPKPLIIGERANANGSKDFKEALLKNDHDAMMEIAFSQEAEGSHLLDLTVAYAGRNETDDMVKMVRMINRDLKTPLCIDSTDPDTIEAALKCYGGKALINSINLEDGGIKAAKILDIAARYGASVIALTIDESGMAETASRKVEAACRLIGTAKKHGLKSSDVMIDTLTFTLGSGDAKYFNAAVETFNAISEIKRKMPEVFTLLGVSNCSYGLKPGARKVLNAVYLYNAVKHGLDAAIFHAGKVVQLDSIDPQVRKLCEDLIFNRRCEGYDPLHLLINSFEKASSAEPVSSASVLEPDEKLYAAVIEGRSKEIELTVADLLGRMEPLEIINKVLLGAMKEVGVKFQEGRTQLPFVLKSAEVVKKACTLVEPHIKSSDAQKKGTIILATVKGDIHDIGKNLVDIILTNNGYTVHNIGTDKSSAEIASAAIELRPDAVGLSALLVKSALEMKTVADHFSKSGIEIPLICGGAALTSEFIAKEVAPLNIKGAYYATDAFDAIRIMEKLKNG